MTTKPAHRPPPTIRRRPARQRSAGNRAVAQRLASVVVQRDAGWTAQVAAFKAAVAAQNWIEAAKRLNNFQRADWSWHVKDARLSGAQLSGIRQAVVNQQGAWGWAVRVRGVLERAD